MYADVYGKVRALVAEFARTNKGATREEVCCTPAPRFRTASDDFEGVDPDQRQTLPAALHGTTTMRHLYAVG